MARVFCNFPCVFSEVGKKADFLPDYVHIFLEYAELKAYVFISLPVRILRFRKLFSLLQDYLPCSNIQPAGRISA